MFRPQFLPRAVTPRAFFLPQPFVRQWPSSQCQRAFLATKAATPTEPKRRTGLIVFGSILLATTGYVVFTDDGKFAYTAARRTGSVMNTLFANILDYRKTLKQDNTLSPEDYRRALKACHKRCALRTLATMEKNGSIFIKLGQHLTSLNYMLPSEWCDTFIPLQDRCPVSSFESVKAMVEKDTGEPFETFFSSFEEQPIGAASLAQVHLAVDRKSGQRVAVKMQHPTLDDWAPLDLKLTAFTFKMLKRFFPEYDLTWLSNEMYVSLPQELNFRLEGDNARYAKEYFSHVKNTPLVIPDVLWAIRRVVVMQYVTGHRIDDLNFLDSHHISRDEVAAALARIFNTMIFSPNAPLHCDPHGGNIAITYNESRKYPYNFDIILYDHGLYRRIPKDLQCSYAKLWLAVLDTDESRMRKYAREIAGITDEQFPLFASAITGRDYRAVTKSVSQTPQDEQEKQAISDALAEGMLQQLIQLLGKVPPIILLILKTNDLTRSLEVGLQTGSGPIHSFLILARYAAHTVFDEQIDALRRTGSTIWPLRNAVTLLSAWTSYARVEVKLRLYEFVMSLRTFVGMSSGLPAPPVAAS